MKDSDATIFDDKAESVLSSKPRSKSYKITSDKNSLRVLLVDGYFTDVTLKCRLLSLNIFIVDSESSLKMMKMLLKKLNIVADTAENGRIAVDMIMGAAEPYQLVFMDNLMPEMVRNHSLTTLPVSSVLLSVIYDIFYRTAWRLLSPFANKDSNI